MAKTKVAPIKRITLPQLKLCGTVLMARLLRHASEVLNIDDIFAWTDSTLVLSWLQGNPKQFKVFVGNRIFEIRHLVWSDRWQHIAGIHNPADCASRGLFPAALCEHQLWWRGPDWLKGPKLSWLTTPPLDDIQITEEEKDTLSELALMTQVELPILECVSNFKTLRPITACIIRFIHNSRAQCNNEATLSTKYLTTAELHTAEE